MASNTDFSQKEAKIRSPVPIAPNVDTDSLAPSHDELMAVFRKKYMRKALGWSPELRLRFGYFTPDDYYEAVVSKLVHSGCRWVDVGCGRDIFPQNAALAEELSRKASCVLGIDPSPNIRDNQIVTERFEGSVEQYEGAMTFDLVTMRMVAEHVESRDLVARKIAQITNRGGLVVVYTPNKRSPVSIAARLIPFKAHHRIKQIFWNTDERDTFPTYYKLNTREDIRNNLERYGLREVFFAHLDDCRTTQGYRALNYIELSVRTACSRLNVPHPENCLLGIYRKS